MKLETNNTLNTDLWSDDNELLPEVKSKIQEIVDHFINNLKEDKVDIEVKDVVIVGSNANYNYTDNSDIDVHIVVDLDDGTDKDFLLTKIYDAYRKLFNDKYDIKIKGHEVELYIEPNEIKANSNGAYSLKDGWLKVPEKDFDIEYDEDEYNQKLEEYENKIFDLLDSRDESLEDNAKLNAINELIDELYVMRQESIMKDGEYGVGNLVFKALRNEGLLQKLKDLKTKVEEQELSLEECGIMEKWNRTAYGFKELEYKGYVITDYKDFPMGIFGPGGYRFSVDFHGDEAGFNSLKDAKAAIDELVGKDELTESMRTDEEKHDALVRYLDFQPEDVYASSWDDSVFETPDGSYLVTNGDDAYDRAVYSAEEIISDLGPYGAIQNEYIEYWLEDVVNEDEIDEILEEEIDYLESEDEEGADSVREIAESGTIYDKINYLEDMGFNFKNRDTEIFDYHKLAEKCVDEDGPAHYLATYDGKEIDLGNGLYAYKVD